MSTNPPPFSVGTGYDIHRFAEGRELWLGGIRIDSHLGLDGHSDADVLLHAICDALLGAAGLKDIGYYFPPSDEKWRGVDSKKLLRRVVGLVGEEGWLVGNVDAVVIAETPKIGRYIDEMKIVIAEILDVAPSRVGIKATTNEALGAIGRREGIAALATALLFRG